MEIRVLEVEAMWRWAVKLAVEKHGPLGTKSIPHASPARGVEAKAVGGKHYRRKIVMRYQAVDCSIQKRHPGRELQAL